MSDLYKLGLREAAQRIRSGRLQTGDYIGGLLTRIDRLEPDVQAWQWLDRARAVELARQADQTDAHWRADGKELYYRSTDQKLMAVDVQTGETFQAGTPRVLFQAQIAQGPASTKYRPDPKGEKFLVVSTIGRDAQAPTTVVLNWFAALEK